MAMPKHDMPNRNRFTTRILIVCVDTFPYFGTDDLYLNYLAHFVKTGGQVAIAGTGLSFPLRSAPRSNASWVGSTASFFRCLLDCGSQPYASHGRARFSKPAIVSLIVATSSAISKPNMPASTKSAPLRKA
jgi:hypothetical protein